MQESEDGTALYRSVLSDLLADGVIARSSKVLVVCGSEVDQGVFASLKFENVTISNLRPLSGEPGRNPYSPFNWSLQDAEKLSYADNSFDVVVVHSGLHHLRCPQNGISEMYRVASRGIVGIEPARNVFTSLCVKMGIGQEYELAAVRYNDCRVGGVADSCIPNYVYRFSKSDILRTVQSFAAVARPRVRFWHATQIPFYFRRTEVTGRRLLLATLVPLWLFLGKVFPFLANNMAFFVAKPDLPGDLFPWLGMEGGNIVPNREYMERIFGSLKS
jgi:SAM-dependent methyltransferase